MRPLLLFIIDSDPRHSGRPAEAVRIAAGVGVWEKAEVNVYLRGEAVRALGEFGDELVDGGNYARYWPVIAGWGRPVYAEAGAPALADLGAAPVPFEELTGESLAELAARSRYVLRF